MADTLAYRMFEQEEWDWLDRLVNGVEWDEPKMVMDRAEAIEQAERVEGHNIAYSNSLMRCRYTDEEIKREWPPHEKPKRLTSEEWREARIRNMVIAEKYQKGDSIEDIIAATGTTEKHIRDLVLRRHLYRASHAPEQSFVTPTQQHGIYQRVYYVNGERVTTWFVK